MNTSSELWLPDSLKHINWYTVVNWIVKLISQWMSGHRKVKRLEAQLEKREAELAQCQSTAAWMGPLAGVGLVLVVVLLFFKTCRA